MVEGPLIVILEMITLLVTNAISTIFALLGLVSKLLGSLSAVSAAGGGTGILIGIFVLFIVGFFIVKFLSGSVKMIFLLLLAGFMILMFIAWGSGVV